MYFLWNKCGPAENSIYELLNKKLDFCGFSTYNFPSLMPIFVF